jgi:glutaminyl-tRNA synthetase
VPNPGTTHDFLQDINPEAKKTITAQLEPSLRDAKAEERFQFERHGYFVVDRGDASVFNRTVSLRDSWTSQSAPRK